MRVVLQRVSRASVTVDGEAVGEIQAGLLLLVGFGQGDTPDTIPPLVKKIVEMRIFPNEAGRFDRSVLQVDGEILVVSQFTLYADTARGRRPEFVRALPPAQAEPLYQQFLEALTATGVRKVASRVFRAMMKVQLENDGPVTIIVDG